MSDGLIPTLDGKRVLVASEDRNGRKRYVHEDGTEITPARAADIVYAPTFMSTSGGNEPPPTWWAAVDLSADIGEMLFADDPSEDVDVDAEVASWLMKVGESHRPQATVELDPDFFHTSLRAWLDDGESPKANASWDYSFWKAELAPLDFDDDTVPKGSVPDGARVYEARVWLGEDTPPDHIRYFISAEASAEGASLDDVESGWLTPPPDLLRLSSEDHRDSPAANALDLEALFGER